LLGARSSRSWVRWLKPDGPRAVICVRLLLGLVFFSEGVQKFLYPSTLGTGRFAKIGIPAADFFATLDGVVEIVWGRLLSWDCSPGWPRSRC
jgi:uncharacterized membrane protein YphA (DoxX/SURF4 family)